MPKNIYHTENRTRLQSGIRQAAEWSEFTYKDDPGYIAFCTAIIEEVENQGIKRPGKNGPELNAVRHNKLFGAWYIATTFRKHWQHPTSRSENDMLWVLLHRGWSRNQGIIAVIAWWRVHHRKITQPMLLDLERLADQVWEQIQREKRKRKMEAQQDSLRNRIIALLQQHPATTAFLAEKLAATSKAVDSHLYRLRKAGMVERLSWGLYALRTGGPSDNKPTHTAATAEDRPIPHTDATIAHKPAARTVPLHLDDVGDGVVPPKHLRSLSHREPHSTAAADDLEWNTFETPTAEPRWSGL